MENKLVFIISALIASYILYRLLSSFNKGSSDYQKSVEELLSSEEYKVKGRYD